MIDFVKFFSDSSTLVLSLNQNEITASSSLLAVRDDREWELFKKAVPQDRWNDVVLQWSQQGYEVTGPLTNCHVAVALHVLKTVKYQGPKKNYTEIYKDVQKIPSTDPKPQFCGFLRGPLGALDNRSQFIQEGFDLEGDSYFEYLSKYIATTPLDNQLVIPGPLANGVQTFYYVYKTIFQDEILAYALVSINDQPSVLLFAPTETSLLHPYFVDSLESDLDPTGIGAQTFQKNARCLRELLSDPKFCQKQIIVSGFSLGGVFAQRFTADSDNHTRIQKVYCFNSPAIDSYTVKAYQDKLNDLPGPEIIYVRADGTADTIGDFCDHGGEAYLHSNRGNGKVILCTWHETSSAWERHTACVLNKEDLTKKEFEITSEEGKNELRQEIRGLGVRSWEEFRLTVSRCSRPFLFLIRMMRPLLYKKTLKTYSTQPQEYSPPLIADSIKKVSRWVEKVIYFFRTSV